MDEYQHLLFFEAKDLTDREEEKIWKYFQRKRDSGGGECAMIENVGGDRYKIRFREKEDQERVLQRKFHSICLPDGERCLIVSRTNSPQTQDQPLTSQSQIWIKEDTKSLEKNVNLDIFLLYYLRDNPKAFKVLEKQLSSIGCNVHLDFDEEEAVVRGDMEKGPGGAVGAAEKWEQQVDRIFMGLTERYLCHHVFEPSRVRKVMQDRSFVSDDVRVYTESGYAVVVGEVEAVKEKTAMLEESVPIRRELPVMEKQFKLVEEVFNREMFVHCPEVKVIRGADGIVLEGPDEEVKAAAEKLDELIKKIKEKRVQLPKDLLTFMTTSGAVSKYQARFQQTFRNPVSLDVGSDLVLSSLSPAGLEEAEAAVLRELSVADEPLQGAAAAPPDLSPVKEILIRAKNQANREEFRVDFSFTPAAGGGPVTKVQLVGFTEHVNRLRELLHDYQMNQASAQEVLNLSHPELVDCFDQLLEMIGMKQTNVTLRASHLPQPCVLVSGPRCHVQQTHRALMSALAGLTSDTLALDGPGALRYFQGDGKVSKALVESSCQVLIREQQDISSRDATARPRSISSITPRPSADISNKINLKIKLSSLEDEQMNVLVAPMLNKQLTSTKVCTSLLRKGGNAVQSKFDSMAVNRTLGPGDVLQVDGPPSLGCSKIFFIECSPWDGFRGNSVQALGKGLKTCLDLCVQQGFSSVSIPVIGPGVVLRYPLTEAIQVLEETIRQFGLSPSFGCLSTIHIVIKPGYPDSEECYNKAYKHLSSNLNQGGRGIFSPLTSDVDDITIAIGGGVKLHVVFGDITNETTAALVNSTNFKDFHKDGVCKDILTKAGPEVEAELKAANVSRGEIFISQPGSFPCEAIFHVYGEKDAGVIEELVCKIIDYCENFGFNSVAIPAICAGSAGMDPGVVAGSILRSIKAEAASIPLSSLTDIRLVLIKINVFLAFKEEATQMFPTVIRRVSVPQLVQVPPLPQRAVRADVNSQRSTFLFLGLCKADVDGAMEKLRNLYKAQCSTQTLRKEDLESLTQGDVSDLKQMVESEGLYMQKDQSGNLTVTGLKDGVGRVIMKINASLIGNLGREVRAREEEDLYNRVAWCILGKDGDWKRLPKRDNHKLEKRDLAGGIVDAQGVWWHVDLQTMQATRQLSGESTQLKRLENLSDFILPLYWDKMSSSEFMKVSLQPRSAEYLTINKAFNLTVHRTIIKIERLQNVHLRRAYEAQKKQISDKNAQERAGAGEKLLYHGTTQDNCDSIMKTGFNRSFAGQNATSFGRGTYFAVNASYSAKPTYSRPAADGSQLMFVARVLTGVYTQGSSDMVVPPSRSSQQLHDRFDSVVDRMDDPGMYVVFHDSQAYPDYLITFK
ncbi:protein mono-ADP-ribosyltransferase PARP14-like [Odontesthes bonariensis]|uniref:protein mono-ADP-ribosyltransferase PARP14-like n=1 Tax=Odontesthes bonariensis TaxID=219752 RepID=UPI003F58A0F2